MYFQTDKKLRLLGIRRKYDPHPNIGDRWKAKHLYWTLQSLQYGIQQDNTFAREYDPQQYILYALKP